jgi:predicted GTPase
MAPTDPAASGGLLDRVRGVLVQAEAACTGTAAEVRLRDVRERLDEPLRLALAGKVKAGKSTLLNALVGEELAPTDAGECTRIVTWYREGPGYKVSGLPKAGGAPIQLPFSRDGGAIDVDLQGRSADDLTQLVVDWPSSSLRQLTLIDTPGIASLSADVSARAEAFLTPEDDRATPADAVLYLMKHLHAADMGFLEAFHDEEMAQATPVNAIAVLSRADEVAVGRLDAMESAAKISERYRTDPKVRRVAQTVVPVAGLLAQSGATLREAEHDALETLAKMDPADLELLCLSADRFVNADASLTSLEREALIDRFGLFGVRISAQLIRTGEAPNASRLSQELVSRSGLNELRRVLLSQFAARRDVLKSRSALLAVEAAARSTPNIDSAAILSEVERVTASAHEFAELRLLNALRTGMVPAKPEEVTAMELLLGAEGTTAPERLSLPLDADVPALRQGAAEALSKWQRRAESPMASQEIKDASRVLVRTTEGLLTTLSQV